MLHIAYAFIVVFSLPGRVFHHRPKPEWYHGVPSCPAHYAVWVDESKALAGKDGAMCVKEPLIESWPDHSDEDAIHNLHVDGR